MCLEDYFDFLSEDDIRIKGHRIGIDTVLGYYQEGYTPEEILANLPGLNLEQVYATITYYLHYRAKVDAYLYRLEQWQAARYQAWQANPSPLIQRLRAHRVQSQRTMVNT
ncbi:MAG: DUF433 domain-containing protein [Caldilineaceae bacterium]